MCVRTVHTEQCLISEFVSAESTGPAKVVKAGNPPKTRRGGKVRIPECVSEKIIHADQEQIWSSRSSGGLLTNS